MAFLSGSGEFNYNEIDMAGGEFHSRVQARPVYDDSRRTVKWVEYDIEAGGYVNASPDTTDLDLEDMRVKLTTPGRLLRMTDRGFGSLVVNDGTRQDALWGPLPTLLFWQPTGFAQTALVRWHATCAIPECPASAKYKGLAAYNYEVSFDIDQD